MCEAGEARNQSHSRTVEGGPIMLHLPMVLIASTFAWAPPPDSNPRSDVKAWHFVLPAPGDPFEHPPFRALVLSREKPEDLTEKVAYRGASRRYAQLRFGSPGSVRVTVVLDEAGAGDVDLYVDTNRDRKIDERDRVIGEKGASARERLWRLPLDVAMVEGEVTRLTRRAVVFRLGSTGRTLGYAAAGFVEGTVTMDGQPRSVRRSDGDGNGLLNDPQDRVWLDLNHDGQWDPAAEQFLFATILNLEGGRYVLRSDPLGKRFGLEPLVGTGAVRLALKHGHASDLRATLVGRDGSAFGLAGSEPATVPVGDYRLGTVTATFDEPKGGESWSFVFSDNGAKGDPNWYSVAKDRDVVIDPIGTLDMELSVADKLKTVKAGADVSLQPLLYTCDGLLINVAYRGSPVSPGAQEYVGAISTLATTDGQTLGTAHSGFA
jgi:hypothetical protein